MAAKKGGNPAAGPRLTVHILAAVAEAEARTTSERTKAALAAAKARGVVLGATGPKNLTREGTLRGSAAGVEAIRRNKAAAYTDILPVVRQLSSEGLSLRAIAARLNAEGHRTRRDRQWGASQIANLLAI